MHESEILAAAEPFRNATGFDAVGFYKAMKVIDREARAHADLLVIADLMAKKYQHKPDDFTTSVGTFEPDNIMGLPLTQFESYLAITVGDWRRYAALAAPAGRHNGPHVAAASVVLFERYRNMLDEHADKSPIGPPGCEFAHLQWMCDEAMGQAENWPVDKLSRWLGFVQGVLTANNVITVAGEREFSRPLFHAAYLEAGMPAPPSAAPLSEGNAL